MMGVLDLACAVYVDAAREHLKLQVPAMVPDDAAPKITPSMILVVRNLEASRSARMTFPDGFLHFVSVIEIDPEEGAGWTLDDMVALVASILQWLWSHDIPAVAACDYEHLLPRSGGYKDPELPWPTPGTTA